MEFRLGSGANKGLKDPLWATENRTIRLLGNQRFQYPPCHATARSVGIGVDMKELPCLKIAQAAVRDKTWIRAHKNRVAGTPRI